MCLAYSEGRGASQAHVAQCVMSGAKSQEGQSAYNTSLLDSILNEDATIIGGSRIAITEKLVQCTVRRCLGRGSGCNLDNSQRRGHKPDLMIEK